MTSAQEDAASWPSDALPTTWEWLTLDQCFTNQTSSDKKLPQKEYIIEGELPVVDQGEGHIGGYTNDLSLAFTGDLPTIVFGDHTRCVKYVDFPFAQGADGVRIITPTSVAAPRFAYWMLRAARLPDKGYSRHYKFLKASKFPVPPLNEQRRIVDKIEALTARSRRAKEALDAVPPLLDKLRQSILAAAFRGDLTKEWRAAHPDVEPASVLLDRIRKERRARWEEAELAKMRAKGSLPKDDKWKSKYVEPEPVNTDDLPELPEGWAWASVEELCSDIVDCLHKTPAYVEAGYPAIRTADLVPGQLLLERALLVDEPTYHERTSRMVPTSGDVLYTREGERYGIAATVPEGIQLCLAQRMLHFRTTVGVLSDYFMWALNAPVLYDQATRDVGGSTSPHVNIGSIRKFHVPLAPAPEQATLVDALVRAFGAHAVLTSAAPALMGDLGILDSAILAKAFRGELVPQDPTDEPASALLERIRAERESAVATSPTKKTRAKRATKTSKSASR